MDDVTILVLACQQLGAKPEQVMGYHIGDGFVSLVIDWDIAGGKKYTVALPEEPAPERPKRGRPRKQRE